MGGRKEGHDSAFFFGTQSPEDVGEHGSDKRPQGGQAPTRENNLEGVLQELHF